MISEKEMTEAIRVRLDHLDHQEFIRVFDMVLGACRRYCEGDNIYRSPPPNVTVDSAGICHNLTESAQTRSTLKLGSPSVPDFFDEIEAVLQRYRAEPTNEETTERDA